MWFRLWRWRSRTNDNYESAMHHHSTSESMHPCIHPFSTRVVAVYPQWGGIDCTKLNDGKWRLPTSFHLLQSTLLVTVIWAPAYDLQQIWRWTFRLQITLMQLAASLLPFVRLRYHPLGEYKPHLSIRTVYLVRLKRKVGGRGRPSGAEIDPFAVLISTMYSLPQWKNLT